MALLIITVIYHMSPVKLPYYIVHVSLSQINVCLSFSSCHIIKQMDNHTFIIQKGCCSSNIELALSYFSKDNYCWHMNMAVNIQLGLFWSNGMASAFQKATRKIILMESRGWAFSSLLLESFCSRIRTCFIFQSQGKIAIKFLENSGTTQMLYGEISHAYLILLR